MSPLSRPHRHQRSCSVFLCFALCLLTSLISPVYANDIVHPPSWFIARFQLTPTTVSPGITLQTDTGQLVIRNTTTTPLYLLRFFRNGLIEQADLPINPPATMGTTVKLVNDHVWYWADQDRTWHMATDTRFIFSVDDSSMPEYFPSFHIDTTESLDRPSHPPLPSPQSAMLQMMVGTSLKRIPIDLIHNLNTDYDRQVQDFIRYQDEIAQRGQSTKRFLTILAVGVGIGYLLVGLMGIAGVVMVIKWMVRRWNARTNANHQRRDEW